MLITLSNGQLVVHRPDFHDFTVKLRHDTFERWQTVVPRLNEFIYMDDTKEYYRGDGVTPGGVFFQQECQTMQCYNFCPNNFVDCCMSSQQCEDHQPVKTVAYAIERHNESYGIRKPRKLKNEMPNAN